MKMKFFQFFILLISTPINGKAYSDIVVVVNAKANIDSMDKEQIRAIYLGKNRTVIPSMNDSDELSEEFLHAVVDKNSRQFDSYWNVRQFTGGGSKPSVLTDDEAVKNWLASKPEGIGFIDSKTLGKDTRIKKVFLIPTKGPGY